jgi:hypothetical protein
VVFVRGLPGTVRGLKAQRRFWTIVQSATAVPMGLGSQLFSLKKAAVTETVAFSRFHSVF